MRTLAIQSGLATPMALKEDCSGLFGFSSADCSSSASCEANVPELDELPPALVGESSDEEEEEELGHRPCLHQCAGDASGSDTDTDGDEWLDLVRDGGGAPTGLDHESRCAWAIRQKHPLQTYDIRVPLSLGEAVLCERSWQQHGSGRQKNCRGRKRLWQRKHRRGLAPIVARLHVPFVAWLCARRTTCL